MKLKFLRRDKLETVCLDGGEFAVTDDGFVIGDYVLGIDGSAWDEGCGCCADDVYPKDTLVNVYKVELEK